MRDETLGAVLQLNTSFEPMAFTSARRALALVVKGKAVIVEDHDREIHPGIKFPAVIRLRHYRYVPARMQTLSRKNILLRDRHTCQYCVKKFQPGDLTLDHVVPRSRGGGSTWSNLVACCGPCNRKKADKTLEESALTLYRKPRPVTIHTARFLMRDLGVDDPKWQRYLYHESDGQFEHHAAVAQTA